MRFHHVVLAVGMVVSALFAGGCAAEPAAEETSQGDSAVSAGAVRLKIGAGRESHAAGIQHWTFTGMGELSGSLTPIDTSGSALEPITFGVKGAGNARITELRMGSSVVRVAADGTVLELKVDANASRMFELNGKDGRCLRHPEWNEQRERVARALGDKSGELCRAESWLLTPRAQWRGSSPPPGEADLATISKGALNVARKLAGWQCFGITGSTAWELAQHGVSSLTLLEWRKAGFTVEDAAVWCRHGDPAKCAEWRRDGVCRSPGSGLLRLASSQGVAASTGTRSGGAPGTGSRTPS